MKNLIIVISAISIFSSCSSDADVSLSSTSGSGVGGSTARFTINGDFLYIVDQNNLKTIDVAQAENPEFKDTQVVGWGIETIFGYKDNLFIGGQNGMYIYGITENGNPVYRSEFIHSRSCDPVIANDKYAYVTTRSGNACGVIVEEVNLLTTLDISDLDNPQVVSSQGMINPMGLAFFQGDLFVAEGEHGLKQFDLTDPTQPLLIRFYSDIAANDMIALENTMIITRSEGIYQFGNQNDTLTLFSPIQ